MSELKLEVGKKYVNRDGDIIKIIAFSGEITFPYLGNDGETYTEYGSYLAVGFNQYDLVEECIEPTKPKDEPKQNTSYTIDGVTMNIRQKGNKSKLKYGEGYSYPGETVAVLTDTNNGYICKFKSHSCAAQDYYVCLDYSQASDLYLLLKAVLGETITES